MIAAWRGCRDIVNAQIKAGADVGLKNNDGKTASDIARKNGYDKIVELLDGKGK